MTSDQNWRVEINAEDYLGHQKKKLAIADRRPLIRKASDLVGPGIDAAAIRITDYGDLLATYNGFYSSEPGATDAPNADDQFVGITAMDAFLGGWQEFQSLDTGTVYRRSFTRNLLDPSTIYWGTWESSADIDARITALEDAVTPLYTDVVTVSATSLAVGGTATVTAAFPVGAFDAPPAAWAIKSGFVTGSSLSPVTSVDSVTAADCRIIVTNMGSAAATFTNLPVRWFAQKPAP